MIWFAHRGAPRDRGEENTLDAFERALALGANGLESDIGLTADGIPVLHHRGPFARGVRVAGLTRHELPSHIPTLADLYERCGNNFHLSLDMGAPGAAEAVVKVADRYGARQRLWLTYWRLPCLARWRQRWPDLRLVYPTIPVRPGRLRALLHAVRMHGTDVLNVYHPFCTEALAAHAHAWGLGVFAWGVRRRRSLSRLMGAQIDGVFCDNLDVFAPLFHG